MKKTLIMVFFICSGIVLGSLTAILVKNVSFLSWLSFGLDFGITSPLVLDLSVLTLTFGATFRLTVAVVIFLILFALIGCAVVRRTGR